MFIQYLCSRIGGVPHKPCGLSWQQQRELEWRCVVRECE
nr:MAG TPA: hypothetical protein [Caudoviricetes sp.]